MVCAMQISDDTTFFSNKSFTRARINGMHRKLVTYILTAATGCLSIANSSLILICKS